MLLVHQGNIADNYPVTVLVVPASKALTASLAKSCFTCMGRRTRVRMH